MTVPNAADRRRDAIAVALLVGGIVVYAFAWRQMHVLEIGGYTPAPHMGRYPLVHHWDMMRYLSFVGLGIAVAGILVAVLAHLGHSRTRTLPDEQEDRT